MSSFLLNVADRNTDRNFELYNKFATKNVLAMGIVKKIIFYLHNCTNYIYVQHTLT